MISALRELAQLIQQHTPTDRSSPLDQLCNHPTSADFYRALLTDDRSFPTEEAIAQSLFGKGKSHSTYQYTRSKVTGLLLNQLLITEPNSAIPDRKKAYIRALRELTAARFALEVNARSVAQYIVKRVLRQARRYEFTDLSVEALRILQHHAALVARNKKAFEGYNQEFKYFQDLLFWEYRAEEVYLDVYTYYHQSGESKETIHAYIQRKYEPLREPVERYDSFRLHMNAGIIELSLHMVIDEYEALLEACKKKIRFFEAKPFDTSLPQKSFYDYLLLSATKLRRFAEGERAAQQILNNLQPGSNNWFYIQENYFLLCMHAQEYETAAEILLGVEQHPKWQQTPQSIQESWHLFEAYLHYLSQLEKVTAPLSFRLRKFINEVPIYTKDKRGRNVPVLIVQVLILLNEGKVSELLNRLEALAKYSSRHLREKEHRRTTAFIKILQQIPIGRFHPAAVQRKSSKYLEVLERFQLGHSLHGRDLEVIPYEHLYKFVLESLQQLD